MQFWTLLSIWLQVVLGTPVNLVLLFDSYLRRSHTASSAELRAADGYDADDVSGNYNFIRRPLVLHMYISFCIV